MPKDPDLVLCVARIEGIKNQLNLIKALNNTRYRLVIIGAPAPNQMPYYNECRKQAASNISFINHLPQEALTDWYQLAGIHIFTQLVRNLRALYTGSGRYGLPGSDNR